MLVAVLLKYEIVICQLKGVSTPLGVESLFLSVHFPYVNL